MDPSNFFERTTQRRLPLSEELSHRLTTAFRRRGVRVLSGSGKEDVMILRGRWKDVPGEGVLHLWLGVGKLVCTERVVVASGSRGLVCEETEVDAAADERISRDAVEAYLEADLEFWGRHAVRELERAAPGDHRRPVFILPAEILGVPRPERFGYFGQYLVLGWLTPAFAGSRLFSPVPSRTGDSRDLSVHVFIVGKHVEVVLRMLEAQGMYAARVRMEKALFREMLPTDEQTLLGECGEHLGADRLAEAAQCYATVRRDFPRNAVAVAQADAGLQQIGNRSVARAEKAIGRGALDEARGHVAMLRRLSPGDSRVAELEGKIETAQRAIDEAEARRKAEEQAEAWRQAQIERAIESAEEAIGRGALDEARGHVVELGRLIPGDSRVAELEGKIETAQRAIDEAEARRKAEEQAAALRQEQMERAIESAAGALGRGALDEARGHVAELGRLSPGHPRVAELERNIRTAQRAIELLGREFSPGAMDRSGWTDLHYAAILNLPEVAGELLDAGADPEAKITDRDYIWPGQVRKFLDEFGITDSIIPTDMIMDDTPLHIAASVNALETAVELIDHGAEIHSRDWFGGTPLHEAASQGAYETAEALLDRGANVNLRDEHNGYTPLHKPMIGDYDKVAALLISRGADIHARNNYGSTALHQAAWFDAVGVAELLIAGGADVNAKTGSGGAHARGSTPLDIAMEEGNATMASLLRRHGGRCNRRC